ncbi:plasmid mobilization protein [Acidaminococcus timonensis]|uniref:plasmid mobilization protein n=1 Tax=Acidaminococcus timonensis TaxID=1871002 RepID=UPI00307FB31B
MNQTLNQKPHRLRNHNALVRFTDEEWDDLQSKLAVSQQTLQAYVLNALLHSRISTVSEVREIQMIGHHFDFANQQLRGACSNLNQLAKALNRLNRIIETQTISQQQFLSLAGLIPTHTELNNCILTIQSWRKEMDIPWQCLRQYLALQRPMAGSGTPSNTSCERTK